MIALRYSDMNIEWWNIVWKLHFRLGRPEGIAWDITGILFKFDRILHVAH